MYEDIMKRLRFDTLIQSSFSVFFISMLANVFTYLYQIAMGNLVSVSDFGTINAVLSLSQLLSIPSGMLTSLSVNMSSRYRALGEKNSLAAFTKKITRFASLFALGVFAVGMVFSRWIAMLLKIDSIPYVGIAIFVAALGCVTTVLVGTLQGLQRFGICSFYSVLISFLRLLFGVVFALAGWGVAGGLGALVFSSVGGLLYGIFMLRDVWLTPTIEKAVLGRTEINRYFLHSFWFQLYLLLMANGDVLLIKTFSSSPEAVGVYVSGSTIGKIALYLSNALVIVLFPLVAEKNSQGKNALSLLKKSIALGGGAVTLCSAGILLFGKTLIPLLFGERYCQAIGLLLPIVCYVIPVALLTILINYLMPVCRVRFFAVTMGLAYMIITAIIALWCHEIANMLYVMGGILFFTFLLNCLHLFLVPDAASRKP